MSPRVRGTRPWRDALLAALAGLFASARLAWAGEPAPGGPVEIVFGASEISREGGSPERVVLRGDVRIESGDLRVEAAGAVLVPSSGALYAAGPVRLSELDGRIELRCARLRYNLRTHEGVAEDVRARFNPPRLPHGRGRIERGEVATTVLSAAVLRREGRERFVAEDATITSCEFATPHWCLRVRRVEVVPGDALRASGCTLRLGRLPVFWWPRITWDLSEGARNAKADLRAGRSGRWGGHVSAAFSFPVRRRVEARCGVDMWGFSAGWRETRGREGGAEIAWNGRAGEGRARAAVFTEDATSPETDLERAMVSRERCATKVEGSPLPLSISQHLSALRGEPVMDAATASTLPLDRFSYAGSARHVAELAHRSGLGGGWELEARVLSASDRDVRQEYLEDEAKTGLPEGSYVELRRAAGGSVFSLHSGFRLDPFRTETEYMPEARWTSPAIGLGHGLVLSADAACGWLRRSYDELLVDALGASDRSSFRARTRLVLSRVFRLGPVAFSPYLGTDQALYSEGFATEEPFVRGCTLYGAGLSTRLFGRFELAGRPFRHVLEARAEYLGASQPTADPAEIYGFDRWDDVSGSGRVRLVLDNRLQTKRELPGGAVRSVDLAGLLLGAELFVDGEEREALNAGRDWGVLRAAGFAGAGGGLRAYASMEWDPNELSTLASEAGLEFGPSAGGQAASLAGRTWPVPLGGSQWRAAVSWLSTRTPGAEPTSQLSLRLALAPECRWRLEFASRYALEGGSGWADQALLLARDFHDWELAFRVWYDPAEGDSGASVFIAPRGYPVNFPARARP